MKTKGDKADILFLFCVLCFFGLLAPGCVQEFKREQEELNKLSRPTYSLYKDCTYHKPSRLTGYYMCDSQNGARHRKTQCVALENNHGFVCR